MSAHAVDPDALLEVARALSALRERVADGEDDLLGAHVAPGEARLQVSLDDHIDQVVDVLRAIGAATQAQALTLRNAVAQHEAADSATVGEISALQDGPAPWA